VDRGRVLGFAIRILCLTGSNSVSVNNVKDQAWYIGTRGYVLNLWEGCNSIYYVPNCWKEGLLVSYYVAGSLVCRPFTSNGGRAEADAVSPGAKCEVRIE
jgi:hypothetical protein